MSFPTCAQLLHIGETSPHALRARGGGKPQKSANSDVDYLIMYKRVSYVATATNSRIAEVVNPLIHTAILTSQSADYHKIVVSA